MVRQQFVTFSVALEVFERLLAIRATVDEYPKRREPGRGDSSLRISIFFLVPMYRGDNRLHLAYNSSSAAAMPPVG